MSVVKQSKVVAEVERHGRGKNRRLRELGILVEVEAPAG